MYVVKSIIKLQLRVCVYLCVCVRKFALLSNSLLLRRRSILLQPTVSYSSPLKVICSPLPDHLLHERLQFLQLRTEFFAHGLEITLHNQITRLIDGRTQLSKYRSDAALVQSHRAFETRGDQVVNQTQFYKSVFRDSVLTL